MITLRGIENLSGNKATIGSNELVNMVAFERIVQETYYAMSNCPIDVDGNRCYTFEFTSHVLSLSGDRLIGKFSDYAQSVYSSWANISHDLKFSKRLAILGKNRFPSIDKNLWNDIASKVIKESKVIDVRVEFSDRINWRPGTFGEKESGSCYWGMYSDAKDYLQESDKFLAVKIYDADDNSPIARAWLVIEDDFPIIFNCYSDTIELNHVANILSSMFDMQFRSIDLDASLECVYINSDTGFLFYDDELKHECPRSVTMYFGDEDYTYCDNCHERTNDTYSIHTPDGYIDICGYCMDNYAQCDNCSDYVLQDDAFYTDDGTYCPSCAESFLCTECHEHESETIEYLEISPSGVIHSESDSDYCSAECLYNGMSNMILGVCEICGCDTVINTMLSEKVLPVFVCSDCYNSNKINDYLDDNGDFKICSCGMFVKPYTDRDNVYHDDMCKLCGFENTFPVATRGQIVLPDLNELFYFQNQETRDRNWDFKYVCTDDRIIVVKN